MKNRESSTTLTRLGQSKHSSRSLAPGLQFSLDFPFGFYVNCTLISYLHLISASDFMSLLRGNISFFRCWREMMDPLPEVREDPEVFLRCISLNFYVSLA